MPSKRVTSKIKELIIVINYRYVKYKFHKKEKKYHINRRVFLSKKHLSYIIS